jgi:hypothetical protein
VLTVVLIVTHGWSTESLNGNGPGVVSLTLTLCVAGAAPAFNEKDKEVGFAKIT